MMKTLCAGLVLLSAMLSGQSFGQNKVQYRDFDWSYIESPHFDVYYYGEEKPLAEFTADVSEEAYEQISKHLRWELNKRVSIIIYHSHNDFQQTNVVWTYMQEGILGVTELFKNRVVVPFEGNYELFRHTIHHELVHAVVNDMVYGGSIQSIISGRVRLNIPLWANEGLAEYLSSNWDTNADMILRDLAINEYIPTMEELNYYFAYKGGQSVWRFLAEKYGREEIGEIFLAMKRSQDAEVGFRKAMGMDFEDLSDQWHKYLKREYWGDITGRDEIEEIAKRLTDHKEDGSFYNIAPTISPDGSKIVMLTNRSGYADIIMIDAINGEHIETLVKGNRSVDFEELKWLQPGVSWSPAGDKVIIAAKAGKNDVFYIVDVESGKKEKILIEMDGLFTAAWSPSGDKIAFVGNQGRASDIFVYTLESGDLQNITDDIFSDSEPSWSPDGKRIAFVSDYCDCSSTAESIHMAELDYSQTDIYTIDLNSGERQRITDTDYNENYPIWSNTSEIILYTSDYNGISNIHFYDPAINEHYPVTNVLTGTYQISLSADDRTLTFAGYSNWGWDVYTISNPLELEAVTVEPTKFHLTRSEDESLADLRISRQKQSRTGDGAGRDFSSYIFAEEYQQYNNASYASSDPVTELSYDSTHTEDGEYISRAYKTRFSLDLVNGQATFSNVFGYSGNTLFLFSDILGDHQIVIGTELVINLENSDYFFTYGYLKRRWDLYVTGFHTANLFGDGYVNFSQLRNYGVGMGVSFPLNRFNRLEAELTWSQVKYSQLLRVSASDLVTTSETYLNSIIPGVSWVYDNAVYGATGPVDGFRQNIRLITSPKTGKNGLAFHSITLDTRRYFRFKRDYSLAGRLLLGTSFGADAQKFMLGGVPNWIYGYGETNGKKDSGSYRQGILNTDGDQVQNMLKEAYFSVFAMPLRGTRYYERYGTNVALANLEFRFPFINYFALGFPLKIILGNIRGHVFADIGAAWDEWDEFDGGSLLQDKYGSQIPGHFSPRVSSFGYGVKINFGFALLRIDTAWDVNHNGYSRPQYYFSLGSDW